MIRLEAFHSVGFQAMTVPRSRHRSARPWPAAIAGMALLLAGCTEPPSAPAEAPAEPEAAATAERAPNIVLVFADDLGIGDIGAYGGEVISTPNIDALAAAGVRAAEGYVSHPVCSPSRAGLLTGRYQARHGWEFNPAGRDVGNGMSTAESTFADALKDLGYATGMVGKWHLGYQREHHPMSRGFDAFFGLLAGGSIFIDSRTPGVESIGPPMTERPERAAVYRGFETVEVERYLTDAFTDEAVAFIDRHRDEPFFLYLSHTTPHTPLQATARYLEPYQHIEDPATRVYAAMVGSLDESVARVVAKLREIGQYDNTLIAFLSDNGCAGYIGQACSNAPHAGFKRYHHEGGIRIPFILSWPNGLPAGQVYGEPVISLDLLATFTGAAGGRRDHGGQCRPAALPARRGGRPAPRTSLLALRTQRGDPRRAVETHPVPEDRLHPRRPRRDRPPHAPGRRLANGRPPRARDDAVRPRRGSRRDRQRRRRTSRRGGTALRPARGMGRHAARGTGDPARRALDPDRGARRDGAVDLLAGISLGDERLCRTVRTGRGGACRRPPSGVGTAQGRNGTDGTPSHSLSRSPAPARLPVGSPAVRTTTTTNWPAPACP